MGPKGLAAAGGSDVLAAIDVGSNSVKLLIGHVGHVGPSGAGRVTTLHEEVVVTKLSEGVDARGTLLPAAADRTFAVLSSFAETCRTRGVSRIAAVGTAVLRDAADAAEFVDGSGGAVRVARRDDPGPGPRRFAAEVAAVAHRDRRAGAREQVSRGEADDPAADDRHVWVRHAEIVGAKKKSRR